MYVLSMLDKIVHLLYFVRTMSKEDVQISAEAEEQEDFIRRSWDYEIRQSKNNPENFTATRIGPKTIYQIKKELGVDKELNAGKSYARPKVRSLREKARILHEKWKPQSE